MSGEISQHSINAAAVYLKRMQVDQGRHEAEICEVKTTRRSC